MPDLLDRASDREQQERERAIANHVNRQKEKPDQDADGTRWCLSCGCEVPKQRVEKVDAVRCVDCQQFKEDLAKRRLGH